MGHLITEATLGAWLIKCAPQSNADLLRHVEQPTGFVVTAWCVADTYRSRMMTPGDRAILWVSGDGRRVTRGIWGLGRVTGRVEERAADGGGAVSHVVPLEIPVFDSGTEVSARDLVDAGVTDLEVQRLPQGSNPSWVSKDQLARIESLTGPWPEAGAAVAAQTRPRSRA